MIDKNIKPQPSSVLMGYSILSGVVLKNGEKSEAYWDYNRGEWVVGDTKKRLPDGEIISWFMLR